MAREPSRLRKGKKFHRLIQDEWKATAEGQIRPEHGVVKPSGRRGRVDIFVDPKEADVAVVEIKASDWDRMTEANLRRNVRRQARQIMSYAEPQVEVGKTVSIGIIFPKRPRKPGRLDLVENLFDEEGIPVVWHDESVDELRARKRTD